MELEVIKSRIDDDTEELSYEELISFGLNNLQVFIDKYDDECIDKLAAIVKDYNQKLFFKCAMKHYYLFELLAIDELLKEDELVRKIIPLYPEIIKKFTDELFYKYALEILNILNSHLTLLEYCPISFMNLYEKDIMMIVEHQSKVICWVPDEILVKYPRKIALFVKRKPELLKYLSKNVQETCFNDLKEVTLSNPLIFDYLDPELKEKSLFKDCITNLKIELDAEQLSLAFTLAVDTDNFLHDFSWWMIDNNLVEAIGISKVEYLLRQKEVNEKLAIIYKEKNKFECFCMMLAAFKESPCLIQKTLFLLNSLNEDINFVEVVNEDDETNQDLASEVLISTLSKIAIQYKDELTLLDIRRMIYLYLKKDGIVYCDTFADFKNLDLLRQQKMMELLDDKFLTIKEAKNIIYEFNYGFSYSETLNLINKYASNLDNLLKLYDKNKLSLEEVEEKQILFDLKKMVELNNIHDIEVLREEMNSALINYKGEAKIYERFLYFEDKLKGLYNKKTCTELNKKLEYDDISSVKYEDLVDETKRKKRYLGKQVLVKKVYLKDFKALLYVVDNNKNSLTRKYLMGVKEQLNDNVDDKIICTLIGNNFFGLNSLFYKNGERKLILRYSDLDEKLILSQSLSNLNAINNVSYLRAFNEEKYLTLDDVLDNTRNVANSYVLNRFNQNKKLEPVSLVAFESIDSALLEAAIDLDLSIEVIDRRQLVSRQMEKIECLFDKYMNYLDSSNLYYDFLGMDKIDGKDCFKVLLKTFTSLRISLKNSDLKNEFLKNNGLGLKDNTLMEYFNSIFEKINELIDIDSKKALEELSNIKNVLYEEYETVNKSNAFSKDKGVLSFDLKSTYRQIDKLERKLKVNVTNNKFRLKIFQDLNESLSLYCKNYNRSWQNFGKQFTYEDISDLIDNDKIERALQLVYQNGLYRGKLSHDASHIERCCVYASILANILYPDDPEILTLVTLAAAFHDSGRICERDEKHGDYSAVIVRNLLSDTIFSKDNINIICASVDFHDEESSFEELLPTFTKKYHIKDSEKYEKIAKILKDADALDRLRFIGVGTLNVKYLNFEVSKSLIKLAALLNEKNAMNRLKCLISKFIIRKKSLDAELDSGRLPQEVLYKDIRENSYDLIDDFFEDFKLAKDDIVIWE